MTDAPAKPPKKNTAEASKDALLDELKSIKNLLDQHHDEVDTKNIPTLEDTLDYKHQTDIHNDDTISDYDSLSLNLHNAFNDFNDNDDDDNSIELEYNESHSNDSGINFDHLDDFDELDASINIPDFRLSAATAKTTAFTTTNDPSINADVKTNTAKTAIAIDLLIQEIVDEFVPVIESHLRQRLSEYEPEVIKQLAKKYL